MLKTPPRTQADDSPCASTLYEKLCVQRERGIYGVLDLQRLLILAWLGHAKKLF